MRFFRSAAALCSAAFFSFASLASCASAALRSASASASGVLFTARGAVRPSPSRPPANAAGVYGDAHSANRARTAHSVADNRLFRINTVSFTNFY